MYNYPIALTQQFRFCGNPFRIDSYKGCDFDCVYCFANSRNGNHKNNYDVSNIEKIEKIFNVAFSLKKSKDINVELIRNKIPLHFGGMSDPFQHRDNVLKNTKKILNITNKYNYPIMFSTKTGHISEDYFEILDKDIHAFQISLVGISDNFMSLIEKNTYSAFDRIALIKKLKSMGFWVSLRLQPLINLKEALLVVNEVKNHIDFLTIEHLKIPTDNKQIKDLLSNYIDFNDYEFVGRRNYELKKDIKIFNISKIREIYKGKIGIGDNNLQTMSDSNNCCGIDLKFNNWFKYNSLNILKNGKDFESPKCSCRSCFSSDMRGKNTIVKEYVDDYIDNKKYDY